MKKYQFIAIMMTIDKFKEELFVKLYHARKLRPKRLIQIGRELFSENVGDIRVYMDTEMLHLVTLYPYCFSYVGCESTADQLAFLDIMPDIKETEHEVELTNYYYDCERRSIGSLLTILKV